MFDFGGQGAIGVVVFLEHARALWAPQLEDCILKGTELNGDGVTCADGSHETVEDGHCTIYDFAIYPRVHRQGRG